MKDTVIPQRLESFQYRLACPICQKAVRVSRTDGNTIAMPLTCKHCGHSFRLRFYCPDHKAPKYHVFEAEALYVDNMDGLYTFCPQHTYTTYDLADSPIPERNVLAQLQSRLSEYWDARLFRLALMLESARQRLFGPPHLTRSSTKHPKPISTTRK